MRSFMGGRAYPRVCAREPARGQSPPMSSPLPAPAPREVAAATATATATASSTPSAPPPPVAPLSPAALALLSTYFVTIWGAGFVATRIALQYAAPFTYIGVRYAIAAIVATIAALAMRARWPATRAQWGHTAVA